MIYFAEPILGERLFDIFYNAYYPLNKFVVFQTKLGDFHSKLVYARISNGNKILEGKIYFSLILSNKLEEEVKTQLDMEETIKDNNIFIYDKIIYMEGNLSHNDIYEDLSIFIENIFKINLCKFCENIFIENCIEKNIYCCNCRNLNKKALLIQKKYKEAILNPNYNLCIKRLKREFNELNSFQDI